jgi:hypothetical protein
MKHMKSKSKIVMILFISGFIILVINAVDYLGGFFGLSLGIILPSSGVGVVLFITGYFFGWLYPTDKKKKKAWHARINAPNIYQRNQTKSSE